MNIEAFWRKVKKTSGCWEWTGARNHAGYGIQWVGPRSKRKPERAHRISWSLRYGKIPRGMFVLHSCDNPPCVNPMHLSLGTKKENSRQAALRMRLRNSKLTPTQVLLIGGLKGITKSRAVAKDFGVCQGTVSHIWTGRNWSYLTGGAA